MNFNLNSCCLRTFSCERFQSYLFQYPQKFFINIHGSILISSKALISIRLVAFLVLTFRYAIQMFVLRSLFNIVEYLTSFGFFFTWLYFTMVMQDYLLKSCLKENQKQIEIGKFQDWVGLIYQIAICSQIPVTALFWLILYDYNSEMEVLQFLKQVGVHGFPLFCLLMDYCFNLYQFPRRHLLVIFIAGTLYLIINISFSFATQPVYSPLDWVSLMCYVWVAGCYIIVAFSYLAFSKIWSKYKQCRIIQKDMKDCIKYDEFADQIS